MLNPKPEEIISKDIGLTEEVWESLKELGLSLGYTDPRGNHSPLIREMVSATLAKWICSPYICRRASYTLLVRSDGNFYYRQEQTLQMTAPREKLPCLLEMKPEKIADFLETSQQGREDAEWLRSHWLFNAFSVWLSDNSSGPPHALHTDSHGTSTKSADIPIGVSEGKIVTREILAGFRDYAQWQTDNTAGNDRVDFPIDLPCSNMSATVVIDLGLYSRETGGNFAEIPRLDIEFRNREGAQFKAHPSTTDHQNPVVVKRNQVLEQKPTEGEAQAPDTSAKETAQKKRENKRRPENAKLGTAADPAMSKEDDRKGSPEIAKIAELRESIERLTRTPASIGQALETERYNEIRGSLELPKNYRSLTLDWRLPYLGTVLCVRWKKPQR